MKKQLPARVEHDTIEKLKDEAKTVNRTLSNHVDTILTQHVSKNESVKPTPKRETYGVSPLAKYLNKNTDENS